MDGSSASPNPENEMHQTELDLNTLPDAARKEIISLRFTVLNLQGELGSHGSGHLAP